MPPVAAHSAATKKAAATSPGRETTLDEMEALWQRRVASCGRICLSATANGSLKCSGERGARLRSTWSPFCAMSSADVVKLASTISMPLQRREVWQKVSFGRRSKRWATRRNGGALDRGQSGIFETRIPSGKVNFLPSQMPSLRLQVKLNNVLC